jgi:hypothetical protein
MALSLINYTLPFTYLYPLHITLDLNTSTLEVDIQRNILWENAILLTIIQLKIKFALKHYNCKSVTASTLKRL